MFKNINEVFRLYKNDLIVGFSETFEMLIVALLFTITLGFIFGYLLFITRKNGIKENKIVYTILSTIINIVRSIPFILFIIILMPLYRLILGVGFGVNASKIPLSIIGIAMFARYTEQAFLDVPNTLYETSYSLGASSYQYFRYFLLKEARSSLVLHLTTTIISLISYSTVMGTIGGGGLGDLAINEGFINYNYSLMWVTIVILVVFVQIIQVLGNLIASALDKR